MDQAYTLIPISRKFAEVAFTIAITELMHYMYIQNSIFSTIISIFYNILFFFTETIFSNFIVTFDTRHWPPRRESLDPRNYGGLRETTVADCCYNVGAGPRTGHS